MSPRPKRVDYFDPGASQSYLIRCLWKVIKKLDGIPNTAREIGVEPSTVYRWAEGKRVPQRHFVKTIYRLYEQKVLEGTKYRREDEREDEANSLAEN